MSDDLWDRIEQESLDAAHAHDWGHFAYLQFELAMALQQEQRFDHELQQLLWVLYLDLNGPQNLSQADRSVPSQLQPFDPIGVGAATPEIVERVNELLAQLGVNAAECRQLFLTASGERRDPIMPLAPVQAWVKLAPLLRPVDAIDALAPAPLRSQPMPVQGAHGLSARWDVDPTPSFARDTEPAAFAPAAPEPAYERRVRWRRESDAVRRAAPPAVPTFERAFEPEPDIVHETPTRPTPLAEPAPAPAPVSAPAPSFKPQRFAPPAPARARTAAMNDLDPPPEPEPEKKSILSPGFLSSGFGSSANTHVYGSGNDYENDADMVAEEKAASRTFLWVAIAVLVLIFVGYRVLG